MAFTKCEICGCRVDATKDNYVFANDLHQHRKCPKKKEEKPELSEKEKRDYKELTDAIKWVVVTYNKEPNWRLIGAQIEKFKESGYSYQDQLYTFKYVVERDGTYWGYGRIERFFGHAMEHKQRLEELDKAVQSSKTHQADAPKRKLKVTSKPEIIF